MNNLPYHEDWGDEHIAENGYDLQREIHTDVEVLGRLCQMMDDDPLAFFVWSQRVLYADRTYQQIADKLKRFNPRGVTRQAIYERIKKMLAREKNVLPKGLLMPRAKQKIKVNAKLTSYEKQQAKYIRKKQ
jgi:hypothetical protein